MTYFFFFYYSTVMANKVITLWSAGYSITVIADQLNISERDVRYYLGLFRE